ncbi:MAG: LacI family DNA-binding transcriptional regulator [Nocardioidaceae bacterium]|nr:LacI family DNA-binding transcriptional regulator [Nocardioidaceae bacterium]
MRDVAALAQVSLKTVSRVVNNEPGVSPALAGQVRTALEQLDYRHNLAASNLRRGQHTLSIGVLLQDVANSFSAAILRAVEDVSRIRGVVVFAASLDEEEERERQLVSNLISRQIDGLLLMPATSDHSYLSHEVRTGLSVVVVDRQVIGLRADCVRVDNRSGARVAVEHLLSHGHRRIAFLSDLPSIETAASRQAGYLDALRSGGVKVDPDYLAVGLRGADVATDAVRSMLGLEQPPTAVFSGRNELTMGAARALRQAGLARSVALVGFDDFTLADSLEPAVTVIQQDVDAEGRLAGQMLLERIAGREGPPREIVLPTTLVPRGSGEIPPP